LVYDYSVNQALKTKLGAFAGNGITKVHNIFGLLPKNVLYPDNNAKGDIRMLFK
jgi:hypothetical protein